LIVVGSSPACDLVLPDPDAAPFHARLHLGDVVLVEDLGSGRTTRVGAATVAPRATAQLPDDVVASIGASKVFLRRAAAVAAPARVRDEVRSFERQRIVMALAETDGNQTRAAGLLGISRRTLTNKLNAYGIARPRKRLAPAQSLLR
jgi:DNA-binding NtrC family response regulator